MRLVPFSNRMLTGLRLESFPIPQPFQESPLRLESLPEAEILLDCKGRKICRSRLILAGKAVPCLVYLFKNTSFGRALRRPYAFHILDISKKMQDSGIITPTVLAALKPKGQILNWTSVMVATELVGVKELPSSGTHVFQIHEWTDFDRVVAKTLAHELARFHNLGFLHGDLKTRHILTRVNGEKDSETKFFFVDLEKSRYLHRFPGTLTDIWTTRDLIQLFTSLPSIQDDSEVEQAWNTFLETYLESRELTPGRKSRVLKMLSLYKPGGQLVQGRTVLGAIVDRLRERDD